MYLKIFLFFSVIGMIISCKSNTSEKSKATTTQTNTSTTRTDALPAPTADFMNKLKTQTEGIDYMFRNTNFSISQDEPSAIVTTINMMGTEKPVFMDNKCQSPIRMTYIGQEGIICDIEMYMDQSCMYQVYLINNKPTFSAKITQNAYSYLTNIINQAKNVQPR